jgi:hypothetical protein
MTVIKNLGRHMKVGGAVAAAARVCRLAPLARERREAGGPPFVVLYPAWSGVVTNHKERKKVVTRRINIS